MGDKVKVMGDKVIQTCLVNCFLQAVLKNEKPSINYSYDRVLRCYSETPASPPPPEDKNFMYYFVAFS